MIYYYTIDGLIGAGKSTLIDKLKDNLLVINNIHIVYLPENIEYWIKFADPIKNKNIIELFYEDKKRYAFEFQLIILLSMVEMFESIMNCNKHLIIISERSVETSVKVFQKILYETGYISNIQYNILHNLYIQLKTKINCINGIIYLDTPIDICMTRINTRKRTGESNIYMSYMITLQYEYLNYIKNYKNIFLEYNTDTYISDICNFISNDINQSFF